MKQIDNLFGYLDEKTEGPKYKSAKTGGCTISSGGGIESLNKTVLSYPIEKVNERGGGSK